MEVIYLLEASLYDASGVLPRGHEFERKYSRVRLGHTTSFAFANKEELDEAICTLDSYNLKGQYFYQFKLSPQEVSSYPAIYFGVNVVEDAIVKGTINVEQITPFEMVMDYHSEKIIVSSRAMAILESMTRELKWHLIKAPDDTKWAIMNVSEYLPDPIVIPNPVEFGPNELPLGTYWVRSDGRDLITSVNISKLSEIGIAVSHKVQIQSQIIQWRPRYIISGKVVSALQSSGVCGILEPLTPLLPTSHPLSRNT